MNVFEDAAEIQNTESHILTWNIIFIWPQDSRIDQTMQLSNLINRGITD